MKNNLNQPKFFSRLFTSFKDLEAFINFNKIEQNQIVAITETKLNLGFHFYANTLLFDQFSYLSEIEKEKVFQKPVWIFKPDGSYDYEQLLLKFKLEKHEKPTFIACINDIDNKSIFPVNNTIKMEEDFLNNICELNSSEHILKQLNNKIFSTSYYWKISNSE